MRLFSLFALAGAPLEKSRAKNLPEIRASRYERKRAFNSPFRETALRLGVFRPSGLLAVCPFTGHRVNCMDQHLPPFVTGHSARSARIGSVRVARQAGKKHAAVDARAITATGARPAGGRLQESVIFATILSICRYSVLEALQLCRTL